MTINYTSDVSVYHPWNYGHAHGHQHRHCTHYCWCGVSYCCECSHQVSTVVWTTNTPVGASSNTLVSTSNATHSHT